MRSRCLVHFIYELNLWILAVVSQVLFLRLKNFVLGERNQDSMGGEAENARKRTMLLSKLDLDRPELFHMPKSRLIQNYFSFS